MRLYIEGDYPILLIVLLKFTRQVALIAIQDKELILTNYISLYIRIKVLELVYLKDVYSLPIITNYKNLVLQELFLVLGRQIVRTSEDKEGQYYLASSVNPLDQSYLLIVTQLYSLQPASLLRLYYNQLYYNLTYYKARFVKVIDIFIRNTILSPLLLYLLKLLANYNRILIESPLPIIQAIKTRYKTIYTLNKVIRLIDSYRTTSALREQSISYLTHSSQIRSKSTFIQVQNPLNNHLLFYLGKPLYVRLVVVS